MTKVNLFGSDAAPHTKADQPAVSSPASKPGKISAARKLAAALTRTLLFFSLVVGLQWLSGAFQNEFGGDADEAGHYVTGLMVRDYLAHALPGHPMEFAQDFYVHYPKVALGHWPPFFYLVQAVWGLVFTSSRFSALILMALTGALLALTVCRVVRDEFGAKAGIAMGALTALLPVVQESSNLVMSDMLFTLLCWWAVIYFGRYLDTERARDSIGFGVLASLAILTKGNGLVLALIPPLAMLFSRRFRLLARASFWYPAVIVLMLCAPWYALTRKMWQNITEVGGGVRAMAASLSFYSWQTIKIVGIALSLLAAVGFVVKVIKPFRERAVSGNWAAAGALLSGALLFYFVLPSGHNGRYVLVVAPALMMFLAAGIAAAASWLPVGKLVPANKAWVVSAAAAIVFTVETFAIPRQANHGFSDLARTLVSKPEFQNSVVLVVSDLAGEGMLVAEIAQREKWPGRYVLRGSKVLARSLWSGDQYQLLHATPEAAMRFLDEVPVGIVVLGDWLYRSEFENRDHYHQMSEIIRLHPQHWERLGAYPRRLGKAAGEVQAYRRIGHENKPVNKVRVDLGSKLGGEVENQ